VNVDVELETGCGIVPYNYQERAAVSALQWAVGLELFLLSQDPWRVVLSTDHPNGCSFLSYPALIQLLMDSSVRDSQLKRVNPRLLAGSALADGLSREYTLNEIAIVTRAGPARLLGLKQKGHLGAGADADVAIYAPAADVEATFATPRWLLKAGEVVVEEGQVVREAYGRTLQVRPEHGAAVEGAYARFVAEHGTVAADDYRVDEDELRQAQVVAVSA
jgi:formylmethanofuran dehydrogenase subunit A